MIKGLEGRRLDIEEAKCLKERWEKAIMAGMQGFYKWQIVSFKMHIPSGVPFYLQNGHMVDLNLKTSHQGQLYP